MTKKTDDLDRLMNVVKEKLVIPERNEKVMLLTLTQESWTNEHTSDYSYVTRIYYQQGKKVKKKKKKCKWTRKEER